MNPWNQVDAQTAQLKESQNLQEQRFAQDRQQKYKEELDLIIQLKQKEARRLRESSLKEADLVSQAVQKSRLLEEQHQRYLRDRERTLIDEAMSAEKQRKEELARQKREEAEQSRALLRESLDLETMNLNAKREQRMREIEEYQHHYHHALSKKREDQLAEKQANRQFYSHEQQRLLKMEQDNQQFREGIRGRLDKNQETHQLYERLHAEQAERQREAYAQTIEKPYLERIQKDIEKERSDSLARSNLKRENKEFVLRQIEDNQVRKQVQEYEQARMEYELLIEELERMDIADRATKEAKQRQLRETMDTLQRQIVAKTQEGLTNNCMNIHESLINGRNLESLGDSTNLALLTSSIPGMVVSHERKRQMTIVDCNMQSNNAQLFNAVNGSGPNDSFEKTGKSRRSHLFQPDPSKSYLLNKENASRQPADFKNDYQYIRHKSQMGTYNLIAGNPLNS